ncbi:TPA: hypothetical protein N0F65_005984, partial [Lagenidium giganteum]
QRTAHTTVRAMAVAGVGALAVTALLDKERGQSFARLESPPKKAHVLTRNFIADAVEQAFPAVVNIAVDSGELAHSGTTDAVVWRILNDVNKFTGHFSSNGSGFIISEKGLIVTNAHVVARCNRYSRIEITFADGSKVPASIHSLDQLSDIAVLQIQSTKAMKWPTIKLGTSTEIRPGEWVCALGSPFSLQNSVSAGIISAVARHSSELGYARVGAEYIQTDAAINAGNSGGPLINLDGEVIGINTMKVDGSVGISFAIPIDTAVQVIDQLLKHKKVVRPYIGMQMINFNARELKEIGRMFPDVTEGVIVRSVAAGSPAHKGGLLPGDVIVEFDHKRVRTTKDILGSLGYDIGRRIDVRVKRRGDSQLRTLQLNKTDTMADSNNAAVPPTFKTLVPFVRRAEELDRDTTRPESKLIAYFCRQYAMELGIKLRENDSSNEATEFLLGLMDRLEEDKSKLPAFTQEEGKEICEDFAREVFTKADDEDRAGNADKNTARTFYAAGTFFDILNQFGEISEELVEKRRYCKYKAATILKAIKDGVAPTPGPPEKPIADDDQATTDVPSLPSAPVSAPSPAPEQFQATPQFAPPTASLPEPMKTEPAPTAFPSLTMSVMPDPPQQSTSMHLPSPSDHQRMSHNSAPPAAPITPVSESEPSQHFSPPAPPQHIPPPAPQHFSPPQYSQPSAPPSAPSSVRHRSGPVSQNELNDAIECAKFAIAALKIKDVELAAQRLEMALRYIK